MTREEELERYAAFSELASDCKIEFTADEIARLISYLHLDEPA